MIDVLGGAWGVITAATTFMVGLLLIMILARRFSVPGRRAVFIYGWHTLFCVLYILYAASNTADANGYFYRSLEPGSMAVGTQFVTAFASLFTRFLGFSYLGIFLVFNLIGAIGVVAFYGSLRQVTIHSSRRLRLLSYATVFLPSVSFWSTALGKDAFAFTSVALFLWSALNFKNRIWTCGLAIVLMFCVRPHVAGFMVVAVVISVAVSRGVKPLARVTLAALSLAAASVAIPYAADYSGIGDVESAQEVVEYVEMRQATNLGGGSSLDMSSMSFPVKIFTYLFRPLPYEASGVSALASSVENIFLLALLVFAAVLLAKRWRHFWFGRPRNENLPMLIAYSLGSSAVLAVVTANLGIAVRQKWMLMPILIYLAFCVFTSRRLQYKP